MFYFENFVSQFNFFSGAQFPQWEQGEFDDLLREANTVQAKLPTNHKGINVELLAKTFANLVLEGKINAAMKLLDHQGGSGVLPLSESTINELKRKHPAVSEADPSMLIDGKPQLCRPSHAPEYNRIHDCEYSLTNKRFQRSLWFGCRWLEENPGVKEFRNCRP